VLSVGNLYNPVVRYSFNIPIEDKPQQFFWDAYGPWQECSHLCQGKTYFNNVILLNSVLHFCISTGERKRKILCSRESDRVVVSDQRCHSEDRPAVITEPCNTECELRYVLLPKQNPDNGKVQKVDDRYCSGQHKPDDRESCHGDCNPGSF
ncbi:hypothetical protein GOODEAATRI_027994, partial [Goodea atripinnis]